MTSHDPRTSHVFYRKLTRRYPRIVRGEGCWLYDADGRRYLDAVGGAFVANVGHGVREIADGDRPAGGAAGLRERHRVHQRSGRGARGRDRPALARRPRAGLSARQRVRGGRGGAQAGPAVLGGGRASRPGARSSPSRPPITATPCSRSRPPPASTTRPTSATGWSTWSGCPAPYAYRCECRGAPPLCPTCSGEALEAAIAARRARDRSPP